MSFAEITGQDFLIATLRKAYEQDRISHAYMIEGSDLSGKLTLALSIAGAMNCQTVKDNAKKSGRRKEDFDACGKCPACQATEHGNFTGLVIIEPLKGKSQISIEQIREEIVARAALKPQEGICRTFIIKNAEMMTDQAANALLKTLEEPAPQMLLLLTSAHPDRLPATVISRCQTLRLRPVNQDLIEDWIVKHGVPAKDAAFISKFAEGSIGRAMSFFEDELQNKRRWIFEQITKMPAVHPISLGEEIIAMCKGKNNTTSVVRMQLAEIMGLLSAFYRDVLVRAASASGNDGIALLNQDCADIINGFHLTQRAALEILESIEKCRFYIDRNVNYRVAFSNLMLNINAAYRQGQ